MDVKELPATEPPPITPITANQCAIVVDVFLELLPVGAKVAGKTDAAGVFDCSVEVDAEVIEQGNFHHRMVDEDMRCQTGKLPYLSYDGARKVLKSFKNRSDNFRVRDRHLIVYRCGWCRHWHVGNSNNWLGPGDKARKGKSKSQRRKLRKQKRKHQQ